jgi:integrase
MALDKINYMAVEDFRNLRKETKTHSGGERTRRTVNEELAILRHIFNRAIEWEMSDKNPVKRSIFYKNANSTRKRVLSPEEITRLIEACPPYLKPIVAMGVYTGLRKGDILNLQWKNVDLERGLIVLVEAKTEKKRYIVLNPDLLTILKSLPVKGEYVFPGKNKKPIKDVRKSFYKALKEAGVEQAEDREMKTVFHTLRHSCITLLRERGADGSAVQGFIGHASEKQTEDYTHLTEQFQRRVGDLLTGLVDVGKIVEVGHNLVTKQEIQENSPLASA